MNEFEALCARDQESRAAMQQEARNAYLARRDQPGNPALSGRLVPRLAAVVLAFGLAGLLVAQQVAASPAGGEVIRRCCLTM